MTCPSICRRPGPLARRERLLVVYLILAFAALASARPLAASELRRTPIVRAVQSSRPSIVNIYGHKTVRETAATDREVNGMGTGIVIDERGYIITNQHVIAGVRRIRVTLDDRTTLAARLVAQDMPNDLAILKVQSRKKLPVIHTGTSSDLMTGETVIAIGNAYGYEHTVTRGIISSLHRRVQVSDTQSYGDLIQVDAAINQGNSGGPLLNIDGEMIGINVAVRAGAQGIGFAIPIDKAMDVAAKLMSVERISHIWHGVTPALVKGKPGKGLVVKTVAANSPAAKGTLRAKDVITKVGDAPVERALDLERALLDRRAGEEVALQVRRGGETVSLSIVIAATPKSKITPENRNWGLLGLKLVAVDPTLVRQKTSRYRGGLRVDAVRPASAAWRQGIRKGDILVGMHVWETVSLENVDYILNRPDFRDLAPVKFYILRGAKTLFGHLPVSFDEATASARE